MATKATTETTATKGGCIIYFVDANGIIMVLTGMESKYVSDLKAAPAGAEIPEGLTFKDFLSDSEVSEAGIDELKAKQEFSKRAHELERILKIGEIRHDTPKEISSGRFTVKYRCLLPNCKQGIFKGGCEGSETPLKATVREVREELGMNIRESKLSELPGGNCSSCQMFTYNIKASESEDFEKVVQARHVRRYGELFQISFKPLSDIMRDIGSYNSISSCALTRFNAMMNPPSSSKAAASSSSSRKSPPRSPGSSKKSPPRSPGSSRGTKKGGKKSKRNRYRERAYARRRNKSYKQY
jgi:hypothetical protein